MIFKCLASEKFVLASESNLPVSTIVRPHRQKYNVANNLESIETV